MALDSRASALTRIRSFPIISLIAISRRRIKASDFSGMDDGGNRKALAPVCGSRGDSSLLRFIDLSPGDSTAIYFRVGGDRSGNSDESSRR